jgi:hypothetical protein
MSKTQDLLVISGDNTMVPTTILKVCPCFRQPACPPSPPAPGKFREVQKLLSDRQGRWSQADPVSTPSIQRLKGAIGQKKKATHGSMTSRGVDTERPESAPVRYG